MQSSEKGLRWTEVSGVPGDFTQTHFKPLRMAKEVYADVTACLADYITERGKQRCGEPGSTRLLIRIGNAPSNTDEIIYSVPSFKLFECGHVFRWAEIITTVLPSSFETCFRVIWIGSKLFEDFDACLEDHKKEVLLRGSTIDVPTNLAVLVEPARRIVKLRTLSENHI